MKSAFKVFYFHQNSFGDRVVNFSVRLRKFRQRTMGRAAKILSRIIKLISPIPLLGFTIYIIVVTADDLWLKSIGSALLILGILVAISTIFTLSIILISLLLNNQKEKPTDSYSLDKLLDFSILFTGIGVFITLIYSSYKKELQAHDFTMQYLDTINNSAESNSFFTQYPEGMDQNSYFHNRTLFIHDVVILLYILELLLYFVAEKYSNEIIAFFKDNDFTEEMDVESAPAKEKNILNPLEIDRELKESKEELKNEEPVIENKEISEKTKQDVQKEESEESEKPLEKKIPETISIHEPLIPQEEDKDKNKGDVKEVEKESDKSKSNAKSPSVSRSPAEQEKSDKKKNQLSKTEKPKRGFSLFSDSSDTDDFDLLISPKRTPTKNSSTLSPSSFRKRGRNYTPKDSDDSLLDLTATRPQTRRRTRRITEKKEPSPFGFSFENNQGTSTDSLFDDFSKTSPAKFGDNQRSTTSPRRSRTARSRKGVSPFGFNLTSSSDSTDELLKELNE